MTARTASHRSYNTAFEAGMGFQGQTSSAQCESEGQRGDMAYIGHPVWLASLGHPAVGGKLEPQSVFLGLASILRCSINVNYLTSL